MTYVLIIDLDLAICVCRLFYFAAQDFRLMVLGHYAAAYLARPHNRQAPLWLLLLCANLAEFLWLGLALAGIEPASPASLLDATFQNLQVHMTWSHNLVPNLVLGLAVLAVVRLRYKQWKLALWCALLTSSHVWLDYIVGFEHQLLGADSMSLGLNSYHRFPHAAIFMEVIFAWICLFYYYRQGRKQGVAPSRKEIGYLCLAFSAGILLWLPTATVPMRSLLP
jgi:hypothetical protein